MPISQETKDHAIRLHRALENVEKFERHVHRFRQERDRAKAELLASLNADLAADPDLTVNTLNTDLFSFAFDRDGRAVTKVNVADRASRGEVEVK